ncbi:hypothetical protein TONV_026 [Tipula oleracea nudivirus]|uniref:Uncharacterized protein n=1 Tax=Tipula oleracea nudivirus TaxID=1546257 RepID=A0A0B4VG39_9VIRU|nr:hypothetical protein TONV_026 [Tipula oleracea nudivirus]AJD20086.1 hypothetical protein TONV_026 [Tipula oleracea nudivirus]
MSLFIPKENYNIQEIKKLPLKTTYNSKSLHQIGKYMHTLYTALNVEDFNKINNNEDTECFESLIIENKQNYFVLYTYFKNNKMYLIFANASVNLEFNCNSTSDENSNESNIFQYCCYEINPNVLKFIKIPIIYLRNNIENVKIYYNITEFESDFNMSELNFIGHGHWTIKDDSIIYLGTQILSIDYHENEQESINFYLILHISNFEYKWGIDKVNDLFKKLKLDTF